MKERRMRLATILIVASGVTASPVHAACWKLPNGSIITISSVSTKPAKGARIVPCDQGEPVVVKKMPTTQGSQIIRPFNGRMSAGYFDSVYATEESRQHLGIDIAGEAGSSVKAPISGTVKLNNTDVGDVMQAYLVIRGDNGDEHVLGHITSALSERSVVKAGDDVGRIRKWPGNSHVHWGINRKSVAGAMIGKWGWGRAPVSATRSEASALGWREP